MLLRQRIYTSYLTQDQVDVAKTVPADLLPDCMLALRAGPTGPQGRSGLTGTTHVVSVCVACISVMIFACPVGAASRAGAMNALQ